MKYSDVFKLFRCFFNPPISPSFSLKVYFFVRGGTFSKTSPSLKESKKENEKNLKIGRKKSNHPKKTYRWYFFELIFSLIDPFFSRFEILPFNQIQLPQIRFSYPIPFPFSSQPHIHFQTKSSPFSIHPNLKDQIKINFKESAQFLFFDPSDFHTFRSSYCIFHISNQSQLIFEYKSSFRDSKASCQCSKLFYEYKETLKMEIWELASIYITFSWFSSLPNPFLSLFDYQKQIKKNPCKFLPTNFSVGW